MYTKKCKGCGWEYPIAHTAKRCKFCGTAFDEFVCKECGKLGKIYPKLGICKECNKEAIEYRKRYNHAGYLKSIAKYIKSLNDRYAQWLEKIKSIPTPYKFLTEEQWLEVCRYFNGCAMCDNKDVTTRGFFIPFNEGGKYCDWNVIPLCEHCATRCNIQPNPFKRTCTRMNKTVNVERGMSKKNVERIVQYLSQRMEVLIDDSSEIHGQDSSVQGIHEEPGDSV